MTQDNAEYAKHPAWGLHILSDITKDLKSNNDKLPPVLNTDTVSEIESTVKGDKKHPVGFSRLYNKNLTAIYSQLQQEDATSDNGEGFWIKIPSQEHDSEHFEENVEKLKALSHPNWCTKSANAEPYLEEGDFHIYMVDGKPKVGIRFKNEQIEEIQGAKNNSEVPALYAEEVSEYTKINGYTGCEKDIEKGLESKEIFLKTKEELKEAIENNDVEAIFNHPSFDFGAKKLENGRYELEEYHSPKGNFSFSDLGINENELFKNVEKINGDADFFGTEVHSLSNLKSVSGNLTLSWSSVQDFGSLKEIGGNLDLSSTKITSLVGIEKIVGNLDCIDSLASKPVFDLASLKYLGGYLSVDDQEVIGGDNLEYFGAGVDSDYDGEILEEELNIRVVKNRIKNAKVDGERQKIFEALDIECKKLKNGKLAISQYPGPILRGISAEKLGIDEEELFKDVYAILGDVKFSDKTPINWAEFDKQKSPNAQLVKDAYNSLGFSYFEPSKNADLSKLKDLRVIKGNVYASSCDSVNLGNVQKIKGDAHLDYVKKINLGELRETEGSLDCSYSNLINLRKFQKAGKDVLLYHTKPIKRTYNLRDVGRNLNIQGTDINNSDYLKSVGGKIFMDDYSFEAMQKQLKAKGLDGYDKIELSKS